MSLLVFVAHDGKTLQLAVDGSTRVDAVQQALLSVTGIAVSDQIVMCHGARLDPAKPLAAYKLPVADAAAAEDTPVFLYHKLYLRPGAAPPPQDPLPVFEVTVPGLPHVGLRHPLHAAHSPLIRALPDYEAQFSQQLGEARAFWEASQQRLHRCRQLMSEQEVQARAADAARANVESHYTYIARLYAGFVDKYVSQHQAHSALLSQFGDLSAALSSVALPPQLVTPQWRVLADLQPRVKLAEWHESCSRSHQHFAQKVVELEGVFQLLRVDVERLFLQAPCVDLDALGSQLAEVEAKVEEQGSIVQVLSKDLATVQSLVEAVVSQLGSSAGGASLSGAAVHDSCAAVDTLLEQHLHSLLPRVRACDACVAEFLLRCSEAKACMTRDVLEQLQGIAAQQSRIRDMKHKLALLHEVLTRQAAAFGELHAANRLPAAYRLALAECARRAAWREMYGAQVSRLAEHCGRITSKEASKREAVNRQLERHLPHDLLATAGLLAEPPHATVSLPPSDTLLLPVTPADIARLPAAIQAAADAAAAPPTTGRPSSDTGAAASSSSVRVGRSSADGSSSSQAAQAAGPLAVADNATTPRHAGVQGGSSSGLPTAHRSATTPTAGPVNTPRSVAPSMLASTATWMQRDPTASTVVSAGTGAAAAAGFGSAAAAAGGNSNSSAAADLVVENARLRAELAGLLAQQAARELGEELCGVAGAAAAGGGGGVAAPGASQLLSSSHQAGAAAAAAAAAGAASCMALTASTAAAGASAGQQQQQQHQRPYGHGGSPAVPAAVSAPLPSVTAALQQEVQQREEAAAAAASQRVMTLGPVKAALAAKDELVSVLEGRVSSLTAALSSYEGRITALEAQLAAAATVAAPGASVALSGVSSPHPSSSSSQPTQQKQSQQQQQQQQPQRTADAAAAASTVGQQSVAPAFLLDVTQGASFFAARSTPAGSTAAAASAAPLGDTGASANDDAALSSPQQQTSSQQPQQAPDTAVTAAGATKGSTAAAATAHERSAEQQQQPTSADTDTADAPAPVPAAATAAATSAAAVLQASAVLVEPEGPAPVSVSLPDLRVVERPEGLEEGAEAQQVGAPVNLRHRGSLDSATAAAAATAGGSGGSSGGGGLTGLLSSSVQYLFNRSGSSKGDGSTSSTTGGSSSPVNSPPPVAAPPADA